MSTLEEGNKMYWHYFFHRCLYYKHFEPILSDNDYDFFERLVYKKFGEDRMDMVGWDPNWSLTAGIVGRLSVEDIKNYLNKGSYPEPRDRDRYG